MVRPGQNKLEQPRVKVPSSQVKGPVDVILINYDSVHVRTRASVMFSLSPE